MVFGWMVFCVIVSIVEFAGSPINAKLFLAFAIAKPVESHVHGLCSFWLNFAIAYCVCHRIVGLQRRCRLFVAKFFKYNANINSLARIDVECGEFGLGCGSHYMFDDVSDVEDGTIIWRNVCRGRKKEMATRATASLRFA